MSDISKIIIPGGDDYNIKDGLSISNITRSGDTFTATRRNGTSFTFTQGHQDISGKLNTSLKGANNGLAELDANGKVPTSQLPSYVDDVIEANGITNFPSTGETGKIYVDTSTNKTYRWSGTTYTEISASLALGTTSSTAFRGDYGNSAYAHAVTNKGAAFASGLYKITTNAEGHVTAAAAVAKADITGLGIPGSDTNTHRPIQVNGTEVLGNNTTALNLKAGSNVTVTNSFGTVTIAATDTTYTSKAAASGGTDVSLVTTGEKATWNAKTSNAGTITGITMNGSSKGTSGVVDLGTVITAHQDISGKADKSATVSTVTWDSTNKKLTKTINGTTSDVVTGATILGGLTKAQVTTALGYTPPTTDTNTTYTLTQDSTDGHKITFTPSSGTATTITIPDNNIDLDSVINLLAEDTATGAIASFPDGADNIPVRDLKVQLEPVQDLHGYENPWPAGGGKNLLELPNVDINYRGLDIKTVSDKDGNPLALSISGTTAYSSTLYVVKSGLVLQAGTYLVKNKLISGSIGTYNPFLVVEIPGQSQKNVLTETEQTFTLSEETTLGNIYLNIANSENYSVNVTLQFWIEKYTESNPTFVPYSNICPITGWTGVNVTRTGVNVWDGTNELGYIDMSNGQEIVSDSTHRSLFVPISPSKSYCYVNENVSYGIRMAFYDKDKTFISSIANNEHQNPQVFTSPLNARYCRFYSTVVAKISINYQATDHDYHPGTDNVTIPITFPSEAGTVYGGTLDVTSGVLTVDKIKKKFSDMTNAVYQANLTRFAFYNTATISFGKAKGNQYTRDELIATSFETSQNPLGSHNKDHCICTYSDGSMYVTAFDCTTVEMFMSTYGNDDVVYTLDTPTVIQLDPVTVTTLLGQNNIWADTGDTTVEYRKLYVDKIVREFELNDVVHTSDLSDGAYVNAPRYVNLGSISTLPGTWDVTGITTDMVCSQAILSNPAAQTGDWTVNTNTAGQITVSGSISGTTTVTLVMVPSISITGVKK